MTFQNDPSAVVIPSIDVIIQHLAKDDHMFYTLWVYCVNEWLEQDEGVISAEDYFIYGPSGVRYDEDTDPGDEDSNIEDEDEEEEEVTEGDVEPTNDEIDELIAVNRELINALNDFWLSMNIFKTDSIKILEWATVCNRINKLLRIMPSNHDKMTAHIVRLNNARIQAENLDKEIAFPTASPLYSILNKAS